MTWLYPFSFMGLGPVADERTEARIVIMPLPYDATSSMRVGAREGPLALLRASEDLELFDEESQFDFRKAPLATLPPIEPHMDGPRAMIDRIARLVEPHVRRGAFVVGLGGEHTVSVGLQRPHADRCSQLSVLHVDAHLDMRSEFMGTQYSHACAMRRIFEATPRIVSVGARSFSMEEQHFVASNDTIEVFRARDLRHRSDWHVAVAESLGPRVYVTIDLDGLDPSIVPAVSNPEPGGIMWYDLLDLLGEVFRRREVVGADVVELCPIAGTSVSEMVAARLVAKLVAYSQRS